MNYFPMFTDISGKRCLVAGGGKVAFRKVKTLLQFGACITVVSPEISDELASLAGISFRKELYTREMLSGTFLVIAATDDPKINHEITEDCAAAGIPVNSATSREDSTFLFPSAIVRGPLTIGISTGGVSPGAASELRSSIEKQLPDAIEDILLSMEEFRPMVQSRLAEAQRGPAMRKLYRLSLEKGAPLTREEAAACILHFNQRG